MKIKKTSHEIKDKILNELKNGPKGVAEISENINSNWLTTEKFLKELTEEKIVLEIVSSPKLRVYKRVDDPAFYGLPFPEELRKRNLSLLYTLAEEWKKINKTIPSKTILQKIAVELIENSDEKIDVPVLKFHYGKTTALGYNSDFEEEYELFKLTAKQKEFSKSLIIKYEKMSAHKVQIEQYKKSDMKFYLIKEQEIADNFKLDETQKQKLEQGILNLAANYPSDLEEIFPLFDTFVYCSINALNLKNSTEGAEYLKKIKEIFYLIWETITTAYFFHDAERWIKPEKKELFIQIKNNILNSKLANLTPTLEDLKSEIDSINPEKIKSEFDDKIKEELHLLFEE